MDMLLEAEWDIQLATGWSCQEIDDLPAERVLILHLRWQYNQMRFSGMVSFSGKAKGGKHRSPRAERPDHWKSRTTESDTGRVHRVTKRINIEDLFDPGTANMLNSLKG